MDQKTIRSSPNLISLDGSLATQWLQYVSHLLLNLYLISSFLNYVVCYFASSFCQPFPDISNIQALLRPLESAALSSQKIKYPFYNLSLEQRLLQPRSTSISFLHTFSNLKPPSFALMSQPVLHMAHEIRSHYSSGTKTDY